jgi:hypothetical protein
MTVNLSNRRPPTALPVRRQHRIEVTPADQVLDPSGIGRAALPGQDASLDQLRAAAETAVAVR